MQNFIVLPYMGNLIAGEISLSMGAMLSTDRDYHLAICPNGSVRLFAPRQLVPADQFATFVKSFCGRTGELRLPENLN